jgi:predicted DCC family thiol-disulfide oxidoreductase YuxK
MDFKEEQVVLFDGVCNLCNGFVQFIIKRDPKARFKFAALQSELGQRLLVYANKNLPYTDSVVYLRKGQIMTRSTAALNIARDLGSIWQIVAVFLIIPAFLRDAIYDWTARNRYRIFGKQESCMVPSEALKQRFLE